MTEILTLITRLFGQEVTENAFKKFKDDEEFIKQQIERGPALLGLQAASVRLLREAYALEEAGHLSSEELEGIQTVFGILLLTKQGEDQISTEYVQQLRELSIELHRIGFPLSALYNKLLLFI